MIRYCAALAALLLLMTCSACGAEKETSVELYAMDTVMRLTAHGAGAEGALAEAAREIERMEAALSRTREGSDVSQVNRAPAGVNVPVESDTWKLVHDALLYNQATSGAFDIAIAPLVDAWGFGTERFRVPEPAEIERLLGSVGADALALSDAGIAHSAGASIDLGGIAKGYAADRLAQILDEYGVASGLVSLGGSVYAHGAKPDGALWRIGVRDPNNGQAYACVLSLESAHAVTSGGYQRYFAQDGRVYHHILNPETGYPADSGLISVTIVAERGKSGDAHGWDGALCDALSTALYVMGEEKAIAFWRGGAYQFDFVLITDDGRTLYSSGLSGRFEANGESGYSYEIIQ